MNLVFNYLSKNPYIISVLVTILTIVTLVLTLMPSDLMISSKLWGYDKMGHLLIFGSWTYLLGLYQYFYKNQKINLFTLFFIGISFGVFIELLQYMLPLNRNADLFDIAFDSLGCFAAIVLLKKSNLPE